MTTTHPRDGNHGTARRRRWRAILARAAILALPAAAAALAAEAGSPPADALPEAAGTAPARVTARVPVATAVPLNEPRAIDLGSLGVPGVRPDLTAGVTAKGYTRYVAYRGRKIGQVVLAGVARGGRREDLPEGGFAARLELRVPRLEPSVPLAFEGDSDDRAALIAALERLAGGKPDDAPETVVVRDEESGGGGGRRTGGGSANDEAAAWTAPKPVAAPEPEENVAVVSDGCGTRPDLRQMRAFRQSRTVTTRGGAVVSETACSDSGESAPILRSYAFCDDDIDLEAMTATARYSLYYVDDNGNRVDVAGADGAACQRDPDKAFPIVERDCGVFLDYEHGKAVPRATLVYLDDSNREVRVRGCAASAERPAVDLTPTVGGCPLRHDFKAGVSHRQGTHTYKLDGVVYQAGGCADDGVDYPHREVFSDRAGAALCEPVRDGDGRPVAAQSRIMIERDGRREYVTPCAPVATAAPKIAATTRGCDNPATWDHDLAAGQSVGRERFYIIEKGREVRLTDCRPAKKTYPHLREAAGWENHDGDLFAYRLTTVYIEPPGGRYDIASAVVLPGAARMPFELTATTPRATGDIRYEGCARLENRETVERWKRPDGTLYDKAVGAAAPLRAGNVCDAEFAWTNLRHRRVSVSSNVFRTVSWHYSYWPYAAPCGITKYSYRFYGHVGEHESGWKTHSIVAANHCNYTAMDATRTLRREDGAAVGAPATETCEIVAAYESFYRSKGTGYRPNTGPFPTMTNAAKNKCLVDWGWK